MKIKFGTTLTTFSRIATTGIALLVNILASFILVRKLPPVDYALYQTATKRLVRFADIPFALTTFWIYRYFVQKRKGSWEASLAVTLVAATLGFLVGFVYIRNEGYSLTIPFLVGTALFMTEFLRIVNIATDALRPVRYGFLQLTYRVLYSILIFVLVYIVAWKIVGAFFSIIISLLVTGFVGYYWIRNFVPVGRGPFTILKEWLKGIHLTALGTLTGFIMTFDVFLAYKFLGAIGVAGFFASLMIFTFLREPLAHGLRYLHGYLLAGGTPERSFKSLRAVTVIISPIASYVMFNPVQIMYLINPKYVFVYHAIIVMSIDTIVYVVLASITNIYRGLIKGSAEEASKKLIRIQILSLIYGAIYILMLTVLFKTAENIGQGIVLWASTILVVDILNLLSYILTFPVLEYRKGLIKEILITFLYFLMSIPIAFLIRPSQPPVPRFFKEVYVMAPSFVLVLLVYYALVFIIMKDVRNNVKEILKLIKA